MKTKILVAILFCFPGIILVTAIIHREGFYHGKPASAWVAELRHDESKSLIALQRMGAGALPPLRYALTSSARTERCRAASALGKLGTTGKDAVPDLVRALDDPVSSVQCEAMLALSRLRITNEDVAPRLISRLANKRTGPYAATLLNSIATERKAQNLTAFPGDGLDYGMACLKSPLPSIRLNGAVKLASVASEDSQAKAALESLSHDENGWVRQEVERLIANPNALVDFKLVSE